MQGKPRQQTLLQFQKQIPAISQSVASIAPAFKQSQINVSSADVQMKDESDSFQKTSSTQMPPSQGQIGAKVQQMSGGQITRSKLIQMTCGCDVNRDNRPDLAIKKGEKTKILQVFRNTGTKEDGSDLNELKVFIKFQKSNEIAISFTFSQIKRVVSQNVDKGLLSLEIEEEEKLEKLPTNQINPKSIVRPGIMQQNLSKYKAQALPVSLPPLKIKAQVLLNGLEVTLALRLVDILKEEYQRTSGVKIQQQNTKTDQASAENQVQLQSQLQKKRKFDDIVVPIPTRQAILVPKNKVRRLNEDPPYSLTSQIDRVQLDLPQKKLGMRIKDLPWDILRLTLIFFNQQECQQVKFIDKQFRKLMLQRKTKLKFSKKDIPERHFFSCMSKSQRVKEFAILDNMKNITIKAFQEQMTLLPQLQVLDLLKFNNLNEISLSRLISSCSSNLKAIKLSYACHGIGVSSLLSLSKCKNLKDLQLGDVLEMHNQKIIGGGSLGYERLGQIRKMFLARKFTLEKLDLYQCDQAIIDSLQSRDEKNTLIKLTIGQFVQRNIVKLEEIDSLKKFQRLQYLNLCGSHFPLKFQIQLPDDQNDQLLSVAGCRELELCFFGLKNSLRYLILGEYAYDELLNFLAEMCKNLEMLEINSNQITDLGLVPILKKLSKLRTLDVSGCNLITGICFYEQDEFAITGLQRFVTKLQGYEMTQVKNKLKEIAPECQLELKVNKKFMIQV